jgi:ribosome-associated protein
MDYVDFIVHVLSVEKRAFYGLERLRKSATLLSVEDLNAEIKAAITANRKKAPAKSVAKKQSPPAKSVKKAAKKTAAKKSAPTKSKTARKASGRPAK